MPTLLSGPETHPPWALSFPSENRGEKEITVSGSQSHSYWLIDWEKFSLLNSLPILPITSRSKPVLVPVCLEASQTLANLPFVQRGKASGSQPAAPTISSYDLITFCFSLHCMYCNRYLLFLIRAYWFPIGSRDISSPSKNKFKFKKQVSLNKYSK